MEPVKNVNWELVERFTKSFTKDYSFPETAELFCLSTGLAAPQDSDINCYRANETGAKIQRSSNPIIKYTNLQKRPKREVLIYRSSRACLK